MIHLGIIFVAVSSLIISSCQARIANRHNSKSYTNVEDMRQQNRPFGVVTVTGSDAGYCASVGLEPNCDENFILTARKYKDGTATGTFIDLAQLKY